jgi:D-alanine-D-alanine ligase
VTLLAAVVYTRAPDADAAPDDDRFEEFDAPEVPAAVAAALERRGLRATVIEDGAPLVDELRSRAPDFVFNLAEGRSGRGRESIVPALCEHLGLPYTGSDALTLAATLDKGIARRLVAPFVAIAEGAVIEPGDPIPPDLPFPALAKPACEGSSKGIRDATALCDSRAELEARVKELHERYGQAALVERFVAGPEVTVGVLGNRDAEVVAMLHVMPTAGDPARFVYSLDAKRDWRRRVRYAVPPELPGETVRRLGTAALAAFRALGCRDVARIDFRVDADGAPIFLEANPLPGLSPEKGDLVIATRAAGLSYDDLIARIASRAAAEARAR